MRENDAHQPRYTEQQRPLVATANNPIFVFMTLIVVN